MDAIRFDRFTRILAIALSRRQTLGASALSLFGAIAGVEEATACKKNGGRCKRDDHCCSGTCKKKHGKRRCRPAPGARGCTIESPCSEAAPCPGILGSFCGITLGGKPFCANTGECANCGSNEECENLLQEPGARCISCPGSCSMDNFRVCVRFDTSLT